MAPRTSVVDIRRMERDDVAAALKIQDQVYPRFLVEDEPAFSSRLDLAASYCFAAWCGNELVGYLLAHDWKADSPPMVGAVLTDGSPSEVLYIHDLATAPSALGLGVGHKLITFAFAVAANRGLCRAELIAVEGAARYWRRLGFVEGPVNHEVATKLESYGASATWMTCAISSLL